MENESHILDQVITDKYAAYHGDCVDVVGGLPSESVDLVVTSIPFSSLYTYSNSPRDMGNVRDDGEFFAHFAFLVRELRRVMRPGRLVAVHCMNLPTSKERDGYIGIRDFRGDTIRAFQSEGFVYHSEVCIWKDPVTAMQRTKALGLLHKQIRKDSAMSRQGIPDCIVVLRTPGENESRIEHTHESFPVERWQRYASPVWATATGVDDEGMLTFSGQTQAGDDTSSINMSDTLQARSAREHDDERHLAPLQLECIRRCVRLWSNEGDVVLDPFGGIGSTGYIAVQENRRAILAELKGSYFAQLAKNMHAATNNEQLSLLDAMGK